MKRRGRNVLEHLGRNKQIVGGEEAKRRRGEEAGYPLGAARIIASSPRRIKTVGKLQPRCTSLLSVLPNQLTFGSKHQGFKPGDPFLAFLRLAQVA